MNGATAGTVTLSDKATMPIRGYVGAWPDRDLAIRGDMFGHPRTLLKLVPFVAHTDAC